MSELKPFDLREFRNIARKNSRRFRRFLSRIEQDPPKGIRALNTRIESEVWKEVDCLHCANCCKTMTPTFNSKDIKRISAHLEMTPAAFKSKYLRKETKSGGDWLNKSEPCQFLDLGTNMCSIYEVRPSDCAGFPHLRKTMRGYLHVQKQNVDQCPATYKMVEKMMEALNSQKPLAISL